MIPSWSSPYSSARSSCFVFDTSRNAARMSAELTIQESSGLGLADRHLDYGASRLGRSLYVKRQPRLLDVSQRYSPFNTSLWCEHRDLGTRLAIDGDDLSLEPPAVLRAQHVRPLPHEPSPFAGGAQGSFTR